LARIFVIHSLSTVPGQIATGPQAGRRMIHGHGAREFRSLRPWTRSYAARAGIPTNPTDRGDVDDHATTGVEE